MLTGMTSIDEIARRLRILANAGKVARLKPDSAKLAAEGLWRMSMFNVGVLGDKLDRLEKGMRYNVSRWSDDGNNLRETIAISNHFSVALAAYEAALSVYATEYIILSYSLTVVRKRPAPNCPPEAPESALRPDSR